MPEQELEQQIDEISVDDAVDIEPPEVRHDLDELYYHLKHFVRQVAQGYQRSMLCKSEHGIGKTFNTTNVLSEEVGEDGYVKIAGHVSGLALFQKLQDNSDKVIFLDDCSAVLKDRKCMEIIKAATETDVESRMVSWDSNTNELNGDAYDEEFEFNGQLIICANKIPDSGNTKEIVDSLVDRSVFYEFGFNYEERIDLIKQVAYLHETDIKVETRMMIAEWIEEVTGPSSTGVNLRTMFKCFNQYRYDEENWKSLAGELIDVDEELAFIEKALERHDTVEAAMEEYKEVFDKSRATFYRKKSKMEESLE